MTPGLLLNTLPFETPVEACEGGGNYCYLQTHSLPSCSFLTLQSDPAHKAASAILGSDLAVFSGVCREAHRGGHCFSLAAAKGFLVQQHTPSSVGGWRRPENDLRVVWLESHTLCLGVCQQRWSKAKMGAARFLWLWIHWLQQGHLSKSGSGSDVCSHLSILTFPAAEEAALIHGGRIKSLPKYSSSHHCLGMISYKVLRLSNLCLATTCLSLQVALDWEHPASEMAAQ